MSQSSKLSAWDSKGGQKKSSPPGSAASSARRRRRRRHSGSSHRRGRRRRRCRCTLSGSRYFVRRNSRRCARTKPSVVDDSSRKDSPSSLSSQRLLPQETDYDFCLRARVYFIRIYGHHPRVDKLPCIPSIHF